MSSTQTIAPVQSSLSTLKLNGTQEADGKTLLKGPLEYNGSFDKKPFYELTPVIGRQYSSELQLKDLIDADDSVLLDLPSIGLCF